MSAENLATAAESATGEAGLARPEMEELERLVGSMRSFLFDYFAKLGPDPMANIQQIVTTVGKVFHSAAALYNRLDEKDGLLKTWAIDMAPPGFQYEDNPQGHVCYQMTILERKKPENMLAVEIEDLDATPFKDDDVNVRTYGLKSYLAYPVALHDDVVGSLCIVFGQTRGFTALEKQILEAFARAVTLEEERKYAIDTVKAQLEQIRGLNQEIVALNEKLKEENLRMRAELSVAQEIQRMILPRPADLEIEGLDIAGHMEPADEVGGDYYDVLRAGDRTLFGIGDVTGHGLGAGVLMVMTQTAVRALHESGETDPAQFFEVLNRTLHGNVERMAAERSLTLALLDYEGGTVRVAGQHEEVLVIRRDGTLERLDTVPLGFPIGLEPSVAEFVKSAELQLEPGDGFVLYTDGITDAFGSNEEQFGLDRLCDAVSQNWDADAAGVREAVLREVKEHIGGNKVWDDITLVVAKRR